MTPARKTSSPAWSRRRLLQLGPLALLGGCSALEESTTLNSIFDWVAGINDRVGAWVFSPHRLMREFPPTAITPTFKNNRYGDTPTIDPETWSMKVGRLNTEGDTIAVKDSTRIDLATLQQFPKVTQITELRCVEGWSAIAKWGGVRFSLFLQGFHPKPEERFLFFFTADGYYDTLDIDTLRHPQTLLVYEMNDQPLSLDHGGPVRVIAPTKIGYKNVKWITAMGLTTTNQGGFWDRQGYPWYYGL